MKFDKWIKDCGGAYGTAAVLDVTPRVVYKWLSGQGLPRFKTCQRIERMTRGKVTVSDVLKFYVSKN